MPPKGKSPATAPGKGKSPASGSGKSPAAGSGKSPASGSGKSPASGSGSGKSPAAGSGSGSAAGKRPRAPSPPPSGSGKQRIETIDLLDSDDENPVQFGRGASREYVLDGLKSKLNKEALELLLFEDGTSRAGTISTVQLSDVYGIAIGTRIKTEGKQSKQTLDAIIKNISDQINQLQSSQEVALGQFADAINSTGKWRLADQHHDGTSLLAQRSAPGATQYALTGLPPVQLNGAWSPNTKDATLLQCLKYVSSHDAKRAVLFHGSTATCKDGICKLLPEVGPSQGVVRSESAVYGPGLYMSPKFSTARAYACDRAKRRTESEAIVIEILVDDADKVTSTMFGGTCADIIVIRNQALQVLKIRRIHHFSRVKGLWCP